MASNDFFKFHIGCYDNKFSMEFNLNDAGRKPSEHHSCKPCLRFGGLIYVLDPVEDAGQAIMNMCSVLPE